MPNFRFSNTAWKASISALAILAMSFVLIDLSYCIQPLADGVDGSLHVDFDTRSPIKIRTIVKLESDSPLIALGAVTGDKVILDSPGALMVVHYKVGEQIGLTLIHGNSSQHAVVTMLSTPILSSKYFLSSSDMLVSALAAVFAVVIAFKQTESKTYRALTLFFLSQAFNHNFNWAPTGTLHVINDLASEVTANVIAYFGALFAIYYPDSKPTGIRATLARFVPIFSALTLTAVFYAIWVLTSRNTIVENNVQFWYWLLATTITLTALFEGWRKSIGGERQRYQWVLLAIGTSTFFTLSITVPSLGILANGPLRRLAFVFYQASLLFMEIGIAYAVLKHRVFNFGFAVNRAIFYSATTLILLIAFGIVEWLSEHLLHFEGREANVLIDGGIALGVYLAFHKIRHVFEHWLERVFFHKWHANEAKLRQFVKHAAHITSTNAVLRDFRMELKRFCEGATCSIYMQDAEGNFNSTPGSDAGDAKCIDIDDSISVALRSEQIPISIGEEHPSHPHELALPMIHRGDLYGYVMLGLKPTGEEYRPDEIEVLGFAAHQIGLDLFALRVGQLEAEADARARKADLDALKIQELQHNNATLQDMVAQIGGRLEQLRA